MWIGAIFSYFFFKILRVVILGYLRTRKLFISKDGGKWASGTRAMTENPVGVLMPYLLGPRWNCHAKLALMGPFSVKQTISIDTENLKQAESWTFVIYDQKNRTITSSDNLNTAAQQEFSVPSPGLYSIIFRYYEKGYDMYTPTVMVDGEILTEGQLFKEEERQYEDLLKSIRGTRSFVYRLMQYYAYYLLKNESSFSNNFVKKMYLPVGNPETTFYYGYLPKNQNLEIQCAPKLLDSAIVFISMYNEASFPEYWTRIESEKNTCPGIENNGTYLIRVVPKHGFSIPNEENSPLVNVTLEGDKAA